MKQERKTYAVRLNKDHAARKQIAVLRMGGVPLRSIAKITGRNLRTIVKEVKRPEHKTLVKQYTLSAGKSSLPEKHVKAVERALEAQAIMEAKAE